MAIVDFVKDHKELYGNTNKNFKDKARKDCLLERFASSRNLSVKVSKTWFESKRTHYGKLTIPGFSISSIFLKSLIRRRALVSLLDLGHHREEPVLVRPQLTTFHKDPQN